MKTILTLLMPVLAIAAGLTSLIFFNNSEYMLSAVFTVASYLSASLWVYTLNSRKVALV